MRGPWAFALSCAFACAFPALAGGCGPSLRRIHLADAYFERCYAGDRDDRATDPERRACWRAWLGSWRDGQALERIDYAEERLLTLDPERAAILALALTGEEGGDSEVLGLEDGSAPGGGAEPDAIIVEETASAPAEGAGGVSTTAGVPERPSATDPEGAAEDAADAERAAARAEALHRRHRPLPPRTSSPVCAAACEPRWVACTDGCVEGDRACVTACRVSHRTCSRGCY